MNAMAPQSPGSERRGRQVYLDWNQSLVYATTAAYLATRLAGAPRVDPRGPVASLSLDQVYGVVFYYLRHQDQVKAHLAKEENESEEARQRLETSFPTHLREKLLRAKRSREQGAV